MISSLYSLCVKLVATHIDFDPSDVPSDIHDDIRKCMPSGRQLDIFNGEFKLWHGNGKLWKHCFYRRNGRWYGKIPHYGWQSCKQWHNHGPYKEWLINGSLWKYCHFRYGLLCGKYRQYDHLNTLGTRCFYQNGKLHGELKEWWHYSDNNHARKCAFYQNGIQCGKYECWHQNGQLAERRFYNRDGQVDGEVKIWGIDGVLHEQFYNCDGHLHGEYKRWYSNGILGTHCFYQNGDLNGEYKEWNVDGTLWKHYYYTKQRVWYNQIIQIIILYILTYFICLYTLGK